LPKSPHRILFFVLAWIFLGLGFVGIFLPLLPTTPFCLLAAFLFSKSSEKYHQWLLGLKRIGPLIKDWEEKMAIRLSAKIYSTIMIVALFSSYNYFSSNPFELKIAVNFIGACVLAFIWTRPGLSE